MKMKASELRIGNLLIFSNMIQPDRIIAVDRRFFSSASIEEGSGDFEITPYYQPIPLSPEILKKAGFVLLENGWMYLDLIFCKISFERLAGLSLSIWEESIYLPHIKHLHQLQNLYFALTGQELAINL